MTEKERNDFGWKSTSPQQPGTGQTEDFVGALGSLRNFKKYSTRLLIPDKHRYKIIIANSVLTVYLMLNQLMIQRSQDDYLQSAKPITLETPKESLIN